MNGVVTAQAFLESFSCVLRDEEEMYRDVWRLSQPQPIGDNTDEPFTRWVENGLYDGLAKRLGLAAR